MSNDIAEAKEQTPDEERKTPEMAFEFDDKGALDVRVSGDHSRLYSGTVGKSVTLGLIQQITVIGSKGKRHDQDASNFALAFLDGMEPSDAAEALILTQMAATHQAMMMMLRRLNQVETIAQQDSAERAVNKLGRTFAAQMETLKRYRSKGQQVVRVERVMVAEGGQAIVGNVETGGRGR